MRRPTIKTPAEVVVHFCANCGYIGGADRTDSVTTWSWECDCPHGIPAKAQRLFVEAPGRKRRRKRARR